MKHLSIIPLPRLMLAVLMCFGTYAHTQTLGTTLQSPKTESALGLELSVSQNSNLSSRSDEDYDLYTDVLLVGTFKAKRFLLSGRAGASQSQVDDREFLIEDSRIDFVANPLGLGSGFKFSVPTALVVPLSRESRKQNALQTSVSVRPTISYDFSKIGVRGLSLSYGLGVARNVHKYSTNTQGQSLTQYGFSNLFSAKLDFLKDFTATASFLQRNNFSYEGYYKQSFRHDQELAYGITEMFSVAAGHTNEGSALKPNGEDTESILNRNNSEVYLSLSATF